MNTSNIYLHLGDITKVPCDAIVNAANTSLLGGGGVDGAIHRAAGPDLVRECRTLGGCNTGEAKITSAYKLPCKYVIHTVGPVYSTGNNREVELLRNCYLNSMKYVNTHSIESISFPAISTGIYGYPKEKACIIAIDSVIEFCETHTVYPHITFVLFDEENYSLYKKHLSSYQS